MTGIIIQSRLNSQRLPRKAFLVLGEKTVMEHVVDRCLETNFPVVLAVPDGEEEEYKAHLLRQIEKGNFWIYSGHPTDVLDRYFETAKAFKFDPIIRITGDCPLIDPDMIKAMATEFRGGYLSNRHPVATVPSGFDVEIFNFSYLEMAWQKATGQQDREHVTRYIYTHKPMICLTYAPSFPDSWKMSIDTREDYERIKTMIDEGKYPWLN